MLSSLIAALLAVAATTATETAATPVAPQGAAATPATKRTGPDPNRIVCERQEILGSRLGGKKVCKPASQWAEERREARQQLSRDQTQRSCASAKTC